MRGSDSYSKDIIFLQQPAQTEYSGWQRTGAHRPPDFRQEVTTHHPAPALPA